MPATIVEVDGTVFTGRFVGFAAPLLVDGPAQVADTTLLPWRFSDHLAALRDCVTAGGGALELDRDRFADHVMAASDVPSRVRPSLAPLALWWAAGGAALPAEPELREVIDLGSARARLRGWSERERLAALQAARKEDASGGIWFDAIGYLEAMVRASIAAMEPDTALERLDSGATARLLDGVIAHNLPDPASDPIPSEGVLARTVAERALRLCRALGWTPTMVWSAPAAEIDRLLRLIDLTAPHQPAARAAPARRRLADRPGATVFRFEDDPA